MHILILFLVLSIVGFFLLGSHLLSKFNSYYSEGTLFDLLRISVFFILTIYYSRRKTDVLYIFAPLFIAVFILGGERVNFISYFIFLYYSLYYRKGLNTGVILTTTYFCFTGYHFLKNVIETGSGFVL